MLAAPYFKSAYGYFCPSPESVLCPAGSDITALHSPARMLNTYKKQHKDYIVKRFVVVLKTQNREKAAEAKNSRISGKIIIPLGG